MHRFRKVFSSMALACALTASGGGVAFANEISALDYERNLTSLTESWGFEYAAIKAGQNPETLAKEISQDVEPEKVATMLESLDQQAPPEGSPIVTPRTAPWNLACGKAWTGYLTYQAQGMLVCAPLAIATGGWGAVLYNLVKSAGGSAIDFNQLC